MAHQNGKLESLKFSLCTFSKYSFDSRSNLIYFKRRLRYLFPCQYSKQALIYLTTYELTLIYVTFIKLFLP